MELRFPVRQIMASVLVVLALTSRTWASEESEQNANQVEAAIYRLSESDWEKYEQDFMLSVAAEANKYCRDDADDCGLWSNWTTVSNFSETDVVLNQDPEYEKPRLHVHFSLSIPSGASSGDKTEYFVNKEALQKITGEARTDFYDKTGYSISDVDDEWYGIKPDNTLNAIMIPIAFAILAAILIAMFVLNWKCGLPPERVEVDEEDETSKVEALTKPEKEKDQTTTT